MSDWNLPVVPAALSREEVLVCQLNQLYPGDVGCFCVFFLNVARLSSGGSLFLPANEPHCYLSGGESSPHSAICSREEILILCNVWCVWG